MGCPELDKDACFFVDPLLVASRLPYRRVANCNAWPGFGVAVAASRGIPYGADRLLLLWAATMAHYVGRAPAFTSESMAQLFGNTGLLNGSQTDAIARLYRLWGMLLEVADQHDGCERVVRYTVIDRLEITAGACSLQLGSLFVPERLIPVRREVVLGCLQRRSLATLDLYLWQEVTARALTVPRHLSVCADGGVLDQLGHRSQALGKARQLMRTRHMLITQLWPQCPHTLSADGNTFSLNPIE